MKAWWIGILAGCAVATSVVAAEPASWPRVTAERAASESETRYYLLSFSDALVEEVAEVVLGSTLGLPFTVEGSAEATVSLEVADSLTREQLLARFETALAAEGLRLERRAGRLVVTAAPAAVPPPTPAAAPPVLTTPPAAAPTPAPPQRPLAWLAIGLGAALMLLAGVWMWRARRSSPPEDAGADPVARLLRTVDPDAAREAQAAQALTCAPPERTLALQGLLDEAALADAYAARAGCGRWRPEVQPAVAADGALAARLRRARLVPLALTPTLVVAADDPSADAVTLRLAGELGRPVRLLIGTLSDMARALGEGEPADGARMLAEVLATPS